MMNILVLLVAAVLYYLSYKSPKTDLILYGFSGIFFLIAALAGFNGYSDIQTGETISYTYTTFNNQTVIDAETHVPAYSDSSLFNTYLPIVEFLLGLYILIALAVEGKPDGETKQSRNKTE